jgi:hypothetical protein
MNGRPWFAVVLCLSAITGCTTSPMATQVPARTVESDGQSYKVEQLTASTWTVGLPRTLADGPNKTASLVKAIEKASNCKVTDSSYGQEGKALNAQVDCGVKPKNQ